MILLLNLKLDNYLIFADKPRNTQSIQFESYHCLSPVQHKIYSAQFNPTIAFLFESAINQTRLLKKISFEAVFYLKKTSPELFLFKWWHSLVKDLLLIITQSCLLECFFVLWPWINALMFVFPLINYVNHTCVIHWCSYIALGSVSFLIAFYK